jgi:hypothetical protein
MIAAGRPLPCDCQNAPSNEASGRHEIPNWVSSSFPWHPSDLQGIKFHYEIAEELRQRAERNHFTAHPNVQAKDFPLNADPIRIAFTASDHICGQNAGRLESAATTASFERFEGAAMLPSRVRRGHETTYRDLRYTDGGAA